MHAIEGGLVKNKKDKESLKLSLQDLLNLFKPRDSYDNHFGGADPEDRLYGLSHKENDSMRGMVDLMERRPVERGTKEKGWGASKRREDDVYGRRW